MKIKRDKESKTKVKIRDTQRVVREVFADIHKHMREHPCYVLKDRAITLTRLNEVQDKIEKKIEKKVRKNEW